METVDARIRRGAVGLLYARLVHLAWRYRLWNEPAELAFMRGHLAAGQAVRDGSVIVQ